jgi:hypothetical protein
MTIVVLRSRRIAGPVIGQRRRIFLDRQLQRAVRAFVLQRYPALDRDICSRHALREQRIARLGDERRERPRQIRQRTIV